MTDPAVYPERAARLPHLYLGCGSHTSFKEGHNAMEVVSWLAGEDFSEEPACLSPVLGSFLENWNDVLDDKARQNLKPFLARTVGTANDGYDQQRSWLAAEWLQRTYIPVWLELICRSYDEVAVELRNEYSSGIKKAKRVIRGDTEPYINVRAREKSKRLFFASGGVAAGSAAKITGRSKALSTISWTVITQAVIMLGLRASRLESTERKLQASALELLESMIMDK